MYKDNKINKTIGNNIANLRKTRNLKQEAFANDLNKMLRNKYNIITNYDCKTISKWEMGQSIPKIDVLIALCKEYNLSLDELLKDEIKEFLSKTNNSSLDEFLLKDFLDNKAVCVKQDGKIISSFNPSLYKYGQLSYLADNLVEYRSEFSRNFSFTNKTKDVQIIVGIMDVNDNKRELHYLGNNENDIVSVENIPANYITCLNVENNNIIEGLMYCETLHNRYIQQIKLGNGKTYLIDEKYSDYDINDYKFTENNIPNDLKDYDLNKIDNDWTDYATLKGHYIIDDVNLFEHETTGIYYYKNAGIFTIVLFGKIKCSDAQLIKVLTDDYKHRLINSLEKHSDESIYNQLKKEIQNYENKKINI